MTSSEDDARKLAGGPMEPHVPHHPGIDSIEAARAFQECMNKRRSIRHYSNRPVPREVIDALIAAAGTAPSGANKQPWRFIAVQDPALKKRIRIAAEEEERTFYETRASERWLKDLAPLGTDSDKPFLETAPWLVVVFKMTRTDDDDPERNQVYYVNESVGIATGFFLAAAHHAGLSTLTHTPSPMNFLAELLGRPKHERAFLLIPVGYAAEDCEVPAITRKPLDEIMVVDRPADSSPGS